MFKPIKDPKIKTDWTPLAFGIILAIVGVAFIVLKEYIYYVGFAVGSLVCAGSIVLATLTFTGKRSGAMFIFKTIFSVLALATGIVTMICNDSATMVVCLVFAGALAIDGSVKLGDSVQARRYTVYGRTVSLILALISTVAAMLVIRFVTSDKIVDYAAALGICFLLDATCNITIPFLKSRINSVISKDIVEKTREVVAEEKRIEEEKRKLEEERLALEEAKRKEEQRAAEEEIKKAAEERAAKEKAVEEPEATAEEAEEPEAEPTEELAEEAEETEAVEEATEEEEAEESTEATTEEVAEEVTEALEVPEEDASDDLSPIDADVLGDEDEDEVLTDDEGDEPQGDEEDEEEGEEAEEEAEETSETTEPEGKKKKKKKKKNRRR